MSTKAKIAKPPRARQNNLMSRLEPVQATAADNMREEAVANINFKVSPEFKSRFKATAAVRGMSMRRLLEEAFETWEKKNG